MKKHPATTPTPQSTNKLETLGILLIKNHYFVFSIIIIASLSLVVYLVDTTLQMPSDSSYRDQQTNAGSTIKFDKATIDKIKSLRSSSDTQSALPPLPSGSRTNPFSE
ncbi:MAG TPA: hypothetical protein VNX65_05220 [Patescibacteria group bacterium]|jgi:hypothetical protein|nr:hypothetical protein [Patescibacteria group bacterium]